MMEFVDNCIDLKIKRYREIHPEALFSKSFTVNLIQEYEVRIFFHSFIIVEYRRYSQFREFREKVSENQLAGSVQERLPPFPKKKLLKKGPKLSEQRRQLLEKWLQSILQFRDCQELLLTFLGVSEKVIKTLISSSGCRFSSGEKIVTRLIRDLCQKGEKNRSKYLKNFDRDFFDSAEASLSPLVQTSLLNVLVPLCGSTGSACQAIDIMHRILRIECYRFAGEMQQSLFNNLELLKQMQVEKHILNNYSQETGQQGYFIAKLMKEHFDRNGMQQFFRYALNFNDEAVEQFGVKVEGKSVRATICRGISGIGKVGEWTWLNTDNYPGGLKIAYRKMEPVIEVKAEIFLEAGLDLISSYLSVPEKRKMWDLFLKDIKIVKRTDDHTQLVLYTLTKDKKKHPFELALETRKTESLGKMLFTFRSSNENKIFPAPIYQRIECGECFYEVQNVDVKVRRSSSSTEDLESDDDSDGSLKSCKSVLFFEEKAMSKVLLFLKMKPEMARLFVTDLSEETSILKQSFVALKKIVERIKF